MDGLLTFIIFVTLLSYCEPWFFDGVVDHGNVQRCPQSIPRDNFLYALNDTCIQLIREEHSWNDARRYCRQNHGDLVVIQDMTKQQFIMNALKTSGLDKNGIWIGGTDKEREGHWKWVNGQKMTWGNWASGQGPGHKGFLFSSRTLEDCALIRTHEGYKWHDYACNLPQYHYGSICEYNFIPTTTRPTTQTSTKHAPTTQTSTTPAPTTQTSITHAPTTQTSTTPAPTTQTSTTPAPTTQTSITPAPTTQTSTTSAPTTQTSTTPAPTTRTSTTHAPTTQTSTKPAPTTLTSITPAPPTQTSTTPAPTTQTSKTPALTTQSSTTPAPPTQSSTTPAPTTQSSTTTLPTTQSTKPPAQTTNSVMTSSTASTILSPTYTKVTSAKSTTQFPVSSSTTLEAPNSEKPFRTLLSTKAKSTLSPTPIPTVRPTKAASTSTQKMTETKTRQFIQLTTQLVNNQVGPLRRSDNGQKPANKSSTGYIIGGVCAAVVVAGIIVAVFVIRRRRLSSNDANRTVHGAENPMYSVMYDDASVPPVGADIQINDMYEPTKYFANGESMS
ncbi:unnamed protein product [Mytilus edulis]|uniref:C-type lectin domain-containing protein n=1 Tax=Mytilus edulis TaxID=6550 RepID=A0A8S3S2H8_MYTED|nr:unnamed protein product [Mytilus edulis]